MFPGFIQTTGGRITSAVVVVVLGIIFANITDHTMDDIPAGNGSVIVSGPLQMIILDTEQLGDGVLVRAEITNLSSKPVKSAQVILATKDEFQTRLMSEDTRLIPSGEPSLPPGKSIVVEIFLYDQYLNEIKFYTFRAAFIRYDEV